MGAKLLLADDSVTIQKVVELTLADEEYDIIMVSDGASAFQKAEEISPDLIMADIVMPEINGYELCERIRRTPSLAHTPVLLLSSTFETYDETRGQSVGADDHIIKPFESDELTQKIRNLLTRKRPATESATMAEAADVVPEVGKDDTFSPETPNLLGADVVEEEVFEFELTDEFMDQAEEMFEETEETADYGGTESLPELEELAEAESLGEPDALRTAQEPESILDEIEEEGVGHPGAYPEEAEPLGQDMGAGVFSDSPVSDTGEIDQQLMEEEEVNLYEISDEFAETETFIQKGPLAEEEVFKIDVSPGDLIDEFMVTEEVTQGSKEADLEREELTDAEILDAVEEPPLEQEEPSLVETAESSWQMEDIAETAEVEEIEEAESPITEESAGVSWGAGMAAAGLAGTTPLVEEKGEAPVTEPGPTATVDEETLRKIVAEIVDKKSAEIIERVAWEVIPDLAELLIKQEIRRIEQEVQSS